MSSNKFEVLKIRVMQKGEGSGKEVAKDRKEILREERAKRGVCYDSRLKGLSQETTLVLSNTRELDRVPSTE